MIPEALKQYEIKDSVTVEGITNEYVWYHAKILSAKMSQWDIDFQKLVKAEEEEIDQTRQDTDAAREDEVERFLIDAHPVAPEDRTAPMLPAPARRHLLQAPPNCWVF
jgi:hypothetical protein